MLEALFRKIAIMSSDKEGDLFKTLNRSCLPGFVKSSVCKGLAATMSSVNLALEEDAFRSKAWELLKLPVDLRLPKISGESLYGDVSTMIHHPPSGHVYLSDALPAEWALFFKEVVKSLGGMTSTTVVIYSQEMAAWGEDLESK